MHTDWDFGVSGDAEVQRSGQNAGRLRLCRSHHALPIEVFDTPEQLACSIARCGDCSAFN